MGLLNIAKINIEAVAALFEVELRTDPEGRLEVGYVLISCPSFRGSPFELVVPSKGMMHMGPSCMSAKGSGKQLWSSLAEDRC